MPRQDNGRDVKGVAFAIGSLDRGGSETQLVLLARGLQQQGLRTFIVLQKRVNTFSNDISDSGIKLIAPPNFFSNLGFLGTGMGLGFQIAVLVFLRLTKRVNILHGYLPLANLTTAIAGIGSKKCVTITSKRGLPTHQERHSLLRGFDNFSENQSDAIIANCLAVKSATILTTNVKNWPKVHVIHNGLSLKESSEGDSKKEQLSSLLDIPIRGPVIISVANYYSYKGLDYLIRSFEHVSTEFPTAHLVLVGNDRGIGKDLKLLSESLGLATSISFVSSSKGANYLIKSADLFVSSSLEEGMSNAIMEAAYFGIPTVATDVGGTKEILAGGRFGILVQPGSGSELSMALIEMLHNLNERALEASAWSSWVKSHFSTEKLITETQGLYSFLLEGKWAESED